MIHVVTGGSGSGKSAYAEQVILQYPKENRIYLATMHKGDDPENLARIQKHQERRKNMGFETIECEANISELDLPEHSNILLEDMGNLVANEMFMPQASGIHAVNAVLEGIQHIVQTSDNVVIVTNEIFSDGVAYDNATRVYQEFLGAINQQMAAYADYVTEVVYGIPLSVKRPVEK